MMFYLGVYTSHTPDGSQIVFHTWPLLTCFKRREEGMICTKEESGASYFSFNSPPATLEFGCPRNGPANKGQLFGTICNSVEIKLSQVVSCIMFQPFCDDRIMMDAGSQSR